MIRSRVINTRTCRKQNIQTQGKRVLYLGLIHTERQCLRLRHGSSITLVTWCKLHNRTISYYFICADVWSDQALRAAGCLRHVSTNIRVPWTPSQILTLSMNKALALDRNLQPTTKQQNALNPEEREREMDKGDAKCKCSCNSQRSRPFWVSWGHPLQYCFVIHKDFTSPFYIFSFLMLCFTLILVFSVRKAPSFTNTL